MVEFFTRYLLLFNVFFRQLWLSVSSTDFYNDVYKYYSGYGIRYILTISFITSLLYCLVLFNYLTNFKNYLLFDKLNSNTIGFENILNQLPDLGYDGKNIAIDESTPYYLYDNNQNKIAVIDPQGELPYADRLKVPITMLKDKISLALANNKNYSIEYDKLFNSENKLITHSILKNAFGKFLSSFINLYIFTAPLAFLLLHFLSNLVENLFVILLIYGMCKLYFLPISLQTSTRLAIFVNGSTLLAESIISLTFPQLNKFVWIISLWPLSLLFIGLSKAKDVNKGSLGRW